jgi:hypothetical protein
MLLNALVIAAVILIAVDAVILLLSRDWRLSLFALALQYTGVFILVLSSWRMEMAAVKLVAGWIAAAVLGMALVGAQPNRVDTMQPGGLAGAAFRLLAAGLVVLVVFSVVDRAAAWVPGIRPEQALGALLLIGLGMLQLGLTAQPMRVVIGILTTLSGFEIFYAAVENSALVAGLLAVVNLGLALVGAYLLLAPVMEENE